MTRWTAVRSSALICGAGPPGAVQLKQVLLGDNGNETRYLALRELTDGLDLNPNTLRARFAQHAPALATQAAERALADAGCAAREIAAVSTSTGTGYLRPGLTSYVSERLGLRPDVFPLDLVGQGCGAALPNWRAAGALLASGRAGRVLGSVPVIDSRPLLTPVPGFYPLPPPCRLPRILADDSAAV